MKCTQLLEVLLICTISLHFRRLHAPAYIYYLHAANDIFLVFNSSINFVIYCCVNEEFRDVPFDTDKLFLRYSVLPT